MKKGLLMWLTAFVLLVGTASAQAVKSDNKGQRPRRPDFEEMQLKQVLNVLRLDDKTEAKFVPLYKDYQKEMKECRMPRVRKKAGEMSDKEIAQEIERQFVQGRKMIDVKEKYYNKFKKILPMKQVQKIYRLEHANMHRLGKEVNRRQGMKRPPVQENKK